MKYFFKCIRDKRIRTELNHLKEFVITREL